MNEATRETGAQLQLPVIEADTLPKYLQLGMQRWGDRVCMRHKNLGIWQRYTWKEVYEHIRAFTLGLMKLGLQRGETVAMVGDNEPELFWAEYASQAAGAKAVCLYPDMTAQEMQYILGHSDAVFFVGEDQEQIDKILEIRDRVPKIRKAIYWDPRGMWHYHDPFLMQFTEVQQLGRAYEKEEPGLFERSVAEGKGKDIAVLSYTSGTTGLPKGVILTNDYLVDNAFRLIMANRFRPFSMYLSYTSPAWAAEQFFIAAGLMVPVIFNFPEEPETILANIRELGAELLGFGPRQWESLASRVQARMLDAGPIRRLLYHAGMGVGMKMAAERTKGIQAGFFWRLLYPLADWLVLGALRDNLGLKKTYHATTGGAPTAPDVFLFFHAMGIKLRNGYGSTEMGMYTQHMGDSFDIESVGQWYQSHPDFGPPLEYRIDENGELLVRGGSGFGGYYKSPEASAEMIREGWFCTGDAVAIKENKNLVFLDRVKDLRKLSSGHPFPPQFIETRLRFSPFIKDAVILGDEKKECVAVLINIDAETVGRWAEKLGIAYTTFPDLSQRPEVYGLIQKEIERVNKVLEGPSRVKRFVNLPKELDPDEAELTRTRKLRRDFLEQRYGGLIQAIYEGKEAFETEVPVKYRDGRTGVVKMNTHINAIA